MSGILPFHRTYPDIFRLTDGLYLVDIAGQSYLVMDEVTRDDLGLIAEMDSGWGYTAITLAKTIKQLNWHIEKQLIDSKPVLLRTVLSNDGFPESIDTIEPITFGLDRPFPFERILFTIFSIYLHSRGGPMHSDRKYVIPPTSFAKSFTAPDPTPMKTDVPTLHDIRFSVSGTMCQSIEILDPNTWTPEAIVLGLQEGRLLTTTAWDTSGKFLPAITDLDIKVVAKIHLSEPDHHAGVEYTDFEKIEGWK